jgi:hypothetical protein
MGDRVVIVRTLALGSRPRQGCEPTGKPESVGECENEHSHSPVSFHVGSWSLSGLPEFLKSDYRSQNPLH